MKKGEKKKKKPKEKKGFNTKSTNQSPRDMKFVFCIHTTEKGMIVAMRGKGDEEKLMGKRKGKETKEKRKGRGKGKEERVE